MRSLRYQPKAARFPIHLDLSAIDWAKTPLDQGQIQQLASAAFMDNAHNLILVGGTPCQAFSVAGGHSMLASLWSVSDDATRELMIHFYDNLVKKKLTRAQSLQQAQVALLSNPQTAHPFLWAAFELIGDWR